MFALATKNFVDEVDKKGLLIPVSSLNHDIHLLTVVVKHNQFWFWKKPNYVPTDFTLNDVLTGDNPIKAVTETNFLKYSGTFSDTTQASVNAELSNAGVRSVTGKGSSTLKSSFGDLKKEEVELQKLLDDLKDRFVFTVRIPNTVEMRSPNSRRDLCPTIKLHTELEHQLNTNSTNSNVTIEIPISTTLAYSVSELMIHQDGRFDLCVTSDTDGGYETDSVVGSESLDLQKGEELCSQTPLLFWDKQVMD
uniref:Gasdermin Eb n=1 Tax=Oryzias sinensis TaxID=183150 RepID=A0A8C7X4P4_9TELE